jgi:hypothetical protein
VRCLSRPAPNCARAFYAVRAGTVCSRHQRQQVH